MGPLPSSLHELLQAFFAKYKDTEATCCDLLRVFRIVRHCNAWDQPLEQVRAAFIDAVRSEYTWTSPAKMVRLGALARSFEKRGESACAHAAAVPDDGRL
jgi:hypothetical protein